LSFCFNIRFKTLTPSVKRKVAGHGRKVGGQVAGNLVFNFLLGKYRLMAKKPVDGQLAGNLAAYGPKPTFEFSRINASP